MELVNGKSTADQNSSENWCVDSNEFPHRRVIVRENLQFGVKVQVEVHEACKSSGGVPRWEALETVVDDSSHVKRNATLTHRKSEAAPEALANGFSPRSIHERNGSQPIALPQPGTLPKPAPLPSIHEHLLSLASTKQFFDTVIYINHPDTSLQPSEHFSHSLFLCRSEVFAKIISEFDPSIHPKVINLYPSRNVLSHAFEAALRFLYSDHVLTTQTLMPQAAYQNRQAKLYTFEYIMSYWIAGVELGLLPIKSRAHEMVQDLISHTCKRLQYFLGIH